MIAALNSFMHPERGQSVGLGCFSQPVWPSEAVGMTRLGIAAASFCPCGEAKLLPLEPLCGAAASKEARFQHH